MKNILKQDRKKAGYTQKSLAEKLGCSLSTIAKYETGEREPSMKMLKVLMDLYHVDANHYFFDEKDEVVNITALSPMQKSLIYAIINQKCE